MKKLLTFALCAASTAGGLVLARRLLESPASQQGEARTHADSSPPRGASELTAAQKEQLLDELEGQLGA